MELAEIARPRPKLERHVERSVPRRLNQDQLRQGQHMFIFPYLQVLELEQFSLKLGRQAAHLIEARRPKQVILVDGLCVDTRLLLDVLMADSVEAGQVLLSILGESCKPSHPARQHDCSPL